jgi:hypothetical protein
MRLASYGSFERIDQTQSYDDVLSLAAVANWEVAVLASIRGASGTPDERDAQITRSGIYAEYPAIFGAYLELVRFGGDPATTLEALKRAVFLAWYAFKEPSIESGISELPESSVRDVMQALDAALASGRADEEFRRMLARYHAEFGYAFEHFGPVRALESFIEGVPPDAMRTTVSPGGRFDRRGQLGIYWKNVVESSGG